MQGEFYWKSVLCLSKSQMKTISNQHQMSQIIRTPEMASSDVCSPSFSSLQSKLTNPFHRSTKNYWLGQTFRDGNAGVSCDGYDCFDHLESRLCISLHWPHDTRGEWSLVTSSPSLSINISREPSGLAVSRHCHAGHFTQWVRRIMHVCNSIFSMTDTD